MDNIVGLGDISVSEVPGVIIKTFALASCVAITAYCTSLHIAGMIHIVLPSCPENSVSDSNNPWKRNPCYYASTGVPLFINKLLAKGCKKSELTVKVYGGATTSHCDDCFNIGSRNLRVVRDSLTRLGVRYTLADVGGNISRTLFMDVTTGTVRINTLPIII
jgi:chemotaxis protein CheD